MLRAIMLEVLAAADGAGISSPELNTTGVDTVMSGVLSQYGPQAAAPNHFRPSMLVDLEAGRPIEVEAIVGGVVRIAKTHAVPTPRLDHSTIFAGLSLDTRYVHSLDLIYTALKVIQAALVTPQRAA
jgi:2-dehydropantoate 2-reductase